MVNGNILQTAGVVSTETIEGGVKKTLNMELFFKKLEYFWWHCVATVANCNNCAQHWCNGISTVSDVWSFVLVRV